MFDFTGKTALITGGGSGIGRATAKHLAASGAEVIVADINAEGAATTVKAIGVACTAKTLDVTSEASWSALGQDLGDWSIDCMINGAGIGRAGNFEDLSLEDWNAQVAVNLTGVFLGTQFAMRRMRPRNSGVIINISSIYGEIGSADTAGYCATKGGVITLSKAAAMHAGTHCPGVRVMSIAPTYVDSEMLDPVAEAMGNREEMLAKMAALVPAGRVATPEDIAQSIAFLASDHANMISGSNLLVDGGQLAGLAGTHAK